jgi:hypothetical protein
VLSGFEIIAMYGPGRVIWSVLALSAAVERALGDVIALTKERVLRQRLEKLGNIGYTAEHYEFGNLQGVRIVPRNRKLKDLKNSTWRMMIRKEAWVMARKGALEVVVRKISKNSTIIYKATQKNYLYEMLNEEISTFPDACFLNSNVRRCQERLVSSKPP